MNPSEVMVGLKMRTVIGIFPPESRSEPESKLIKRDAYNTSDDEVNDDDESNYRTKRGQDEHRKEEAKK